MLSMTDTCEYCGSRLEQANSANLFGNLRVVFYRACDCEGAQRARQEQEEAKAKAEARRRNEILANNIHQAGIPLRYVTAKDEKAYTLAQCVRDGYSLYIYGGFGAGKTYLACAVALELIRDMNKRVKFMTGIELTMKLQATYGNLESEDEIMNHLCSYEVLVIDDLGKEPPTDWTLSRIFEIIDRRSKGKLPVIITSNYSRGGLVERLERKGDTDTAEAISSRLHEMCKVVDMGNVDRRLQ